MTHTATATSTSRPVRKKRRALTVVLVLVSLSAFLYALVSMLNLQAIFDYTPGMSQDDAAAVKESQMSDLGLSFILPIDPVTLLCLIVTIAVYVVSRNVQSGPKRTTLTTMILMIALALFSLTRVAFFIGMIAPSVSYTMASASAPQDFHTATAADASTTEVQLIAYSGPLPPARGTAQVTNLTDQYWETATVQFSFAATDGSVCGEASVDVPYIAPGQTVGVATPTVPSYSLTRGCSPAAATAVVATFDVDSRSARVDADYAPAPTITHLQTVVTTTLQSGELRFAITGAVDLASFAAADLENRPVGFEFVDADGLHVPECSSLSSHIVDPDGRFTTGESMAFYPAGTVMTAAIIPGEC